MRRGFAIAIVYVGLILIPVLVAAMLVPPIVEQVNLLVDNLPQYVRDLQDFVAKNDQLRQLEEDYNITAELQKQASTLPGRVGDAAGILSSIGLGLVNSVFAGVTIIILSLFMIGSGRHWLDWLADRQGPERSAWLKRLFDRIGNAVGNYVAGALGQAVVAGVLAYIVLLILGVPYAGSLAVVIFLLDLVPLVGATLGAILVGIITRLQRLPDRHDRLGDLVGHLPAGREQHHPAADPGARGAGAPVRGAGVGAVRLDAVRRARRAARDPGRGRDPDRGRRVQQAAQPGPHRPGGAVARRRRPSAAEARRLAMDLALVNLDSPTEVRTFEKGRFELYRVGPMTLGRATYEPGWKWSEHVGAATGERSCQVEHVGLVLSGRAMAAMDDGTERVMAPGDFFYVPPGHDSWVVGDEPYVSLHVMGSEDYAN